MLLKEVVLQNIRSYRQQRINFSEGSTLLSGDIGCGKSSILLAVEFALFGTSRPDLPAEALLKKGANSGAVELTFSVNGKEVIVKRNLKKEKRGIKQVAGYIIVDGVKKELMPTELKAEIITLLGYPGELITKSKNYIYRYTVYTPQEEMKFILQENAEVRLDVLRKIFNIDKYKNIRENVWLYLRGMRTEITVLKTRIEPLEELRDQLQVFEKEKREVMSLLSGLEPRLQELQRNIAGRKEEIAVVEKEERERQQLEQRGKELGLLIEEKQKQIVQLLEQEKSLQEQLQGDVGVGEKEVLEKEVAVLVEEERSLLTQQTTLQEKVAQIQMMITKRGKEVRSLEDAGILLQEKQTLVEKLQQKVASKKELVEKRQQLEELFGKTSSLVVQNETLLGKSKELREQMNGLGSCPTCLQEVDLDHKEKICVEEEKKITQAETLLFELKKKQAEISEKRENIGKEIEEVLLQENVFVRTKVELEKLQEQSDLLEGKKEDMKKLVQENNSVMGRLAVMKEQNVVQEVQSKVQEKRKLLESIMQREMVQQQMQELLGMKVAREKEVVGLREELVVVEGLFREKEDKTGMVAEKRREVEMLLEQEKALSVKKAEVMTRKQNLEQREAELQRKLKELMAEKNKLLRLQELHHWLDEFFIKLTYTIEKRVMIQIHYLFNQLFQEWFSILIDDENMYARIDDAFSPVIEQNGYEIGFSNLSGGERTSASLAYRLALNRVINDIIHEVKTNDILILDEPTDGFSSEQLDKVRDVLEKLRLQQTILVSHETKIESFVENVIRVRKDEGESVVV